MAQMRQDESELVIEARQQTYYATLVAQAGSKVGKPNRLIMLWPTS